MEEIPFKGIVLDLDGVITDTRDIHFKSWKKIFETYLSDKGFSYKFTKDDYALYVDGKPRADGITSFLESIEMPPDKEELEYLKIEKNNYYLSFLRKNPPQPFPDSIASIEKWKKKGIHLAVVSSSENCRLILKELNIENLFEVCVDGNDGKKFKLLGKPHPDYFNEALKRMNLEPHECAVVEDALNGIDAGIQAGFNTVYGMSRKDQTPPPELYAHGAHSVISSLDQVGRPVNALEHWDDFLAHVGEKDLALFLDFDGTLSDIVDDPQDAILKPGADLVLAELSKAFKVAVVSGRDRFDVKQKVMASNIFYAGCHGFDMSGPGCFHYHLDNIEKSLCDLEEATLHAVDHLSGMDGVHVERKSYATAIHFRKAPQSEEKVRIEVEKILKLYPDLRLKSGKKVLEIMPGIDWGKGKAVRKLMGILNIDLCEVVPVYIGDDTTDEDAFSELHGKGIGIRVEEADVLTKADYKLKDPDEVLRFLKMLVQEFGGQEKVWRSKH